MPTRTTPRTAEWRHFTTALAEALAELTPYTYLIVSRRGIAHFVQFAGEPGGSIRAEAVSNRYIETFGPVLSERDYVRMESLGWRRPTNEPPELGPPRDPHGSPNFFRDFEAPVPWREVAELAVAALRRVYRVASLEELEYQAFHKSGPPIAFPGLGLTPRPPKPVALPPAVQPLADRVVARMGDGHGLNADLIELAGWFLEQPGGLEEAARGTPRWEVLIPGREPAVVGWIPIASSDGRVALLAVGLSAWPPGELDIEWYGVFEQPEDIRRALEARGWTVVR